MSHGGYGAFGGGYGVLETEFRSVSLEEIVKACIKEYSGQSWVEFLERLEAKHGLVVRKKS